MGNMYKMISKLTGGSLLAVLFLLVAGNVFSQTFNMTTSPYQLSPKWYWGYRAGMDFTGGAPVFLNGNRSITNEGASAIVDTNKNVTYFSQGSELWRGGAATRLSTAGGGTSSTQGAVTFPDPASPYTRYYVVTGDDQTGGLGGNPGGIWAYLIDYTTNTVVSSSQLATTGQVSEALISGTDGLGNYWIVSHGQGNREFWVWKVTSSGVSAVDIQATTNFPGANGPGGSGGPIKFNMCQDVIAHAGAWGGTYILEVWGWNKTTGKLTSLTTPLFRTTNPGATNPSNYGMDLSPDGSKAYVTNLIEPQLYGVNLATSTWTSLSSASSNNFNRIGAVQLGPNGNIYVTNAAFNPTTDVNVGVISSPNSATPSYNGSGFTMPATESATGLRPSNFDGGFNQPFLSPRNIIVAAYATGVCSTYTHTFSFVDYFGTQIPVSSIEWSFNGGTSWASGVRAYETFTYPGSGTYSVLVRFRDNSCNQLWTSTAISVVVSCPAPVTWASYSAERLSASSAGIYWSTAREDNASHFTVQRSVDGQTWSSLGSVEAAGNSNGIRSYQYIDLEAPEGLVYYRILQVDNDGAFGYSSVMSIDGDQEFGLNVYPNPTNNQFEVSLSGAEGAVLTITDVAGQVLATQVVDQEFYTGVFGEGLAAGTYIVSVQSGAQVDHVKVIKQ
jgi:hypothetical protein